MKKTLLKTTSVALAFTGVLATTAPVYANDNVIATVGEEQITQDEFYQAMKNLSGEITLRTMILEQVLMQNVDDVEASRKAADDAVAQQIEEAGGEETFQQLLDYQQLGSIEKYTYQLFINNMFQEVIEKGIDKSDEAIQDFYENGYEPTMEAQHILTETEEEANAALERVKGGEEFDAVAKEVSKDSTAENGGLLTPFVSGQMVAEFEEAVKATANGEITQEPVKSQYGYHVIKVINNGEKKPLEEVREEVEQQYVNSKLADAQFSYSIIGDLIEQTGVEINDEDLKGAVNDLLEIAKMPESVESPADTSGEDESASEEAPAEDASAEEVAEEEAAKESAE